MKVAHASRIGAFGLELEGGGKEMIDAPMLKQVSSFSSRVKLFPLIAIVLLQAEKTIEIARAAGIEIPDVA
jgi:citrate lyase subunit beta-like protein